MFRTVIVKRYFKVGSHDLFLDAIILLALFQFIEMLIRITKVFEFE